MSTQKVIQNVTKTDNSFTTNDGKQMFQYQITFNGDSQTYDAYSPNFKFGTGDTVEVEANPSQKMPNKIKITAVGGSTGGYTKGNSKAPAKSNYRQDDPNKQAYILYNVVSEAVTDNVLSDSKNTVENIKKYTDAVISELKSHMSDDIQNTINIQACLKRAAKLPESRDTAPSTLVSTTIQMLNDMVESVTGKPVMKAPELEPDFLETLK